VGSGVCHGVHHRREGQWGQQVQRKLRYQLRTVHICAAKAVVCGKREYICICMHERYALSHGVHDWRKRQRERQVQRRLRNQQLRRVGVALVKARMCVCVNRGLHVYFRFHELSQLGTEASGNSRCRGNSAINCIVWGQRQSKHAGVCVIDVYMYTSEFMGDAFCTQMRTNRVQWKGDSEAVRSRRAKPLTCHHPFLPSP
jgi:hypothetical protein